MFTGIIEKKAQIHEIRHNSLTLIDESFGEEIVVGESMSVNGVCLTVVSRIAGKVHFDVMPETVQRTAFVELKRLDYVNIERSLPVSGRLSGHFVQGHVDCTAKLLKILKDRNAFRLHFELPCEFFKYLAEKGSIALNGISLTIAGLERGRNIFWVGIVPHTWEETTLSSLKIGSRVNVEVDILAKYIYDFMQNR